MAFTDAQLANLILLGLRRSGEPVSQDWTDEIAAYVAEGTAVLNDETGYSPDTVATEKGAKAKRYYALWQFYDVIPSKSSLANKYAKEYEQQKLEFLIEAARETQNGLTAAGQEKTEERILRDLAHNGLIINAAEITNVKRRFDDCYTELKERTGYNPNAHAVTLAREAAYYYAMWKTLQGGGRLQQAANTMKAEFGVAAQTWSNAAAIDVNLTLLNDADLRRRTQDYTPNLSEDVDQSRWSANQRSAGEDFHSKPPITTLDESAFTVTGSGATPHTIDLSSGFSDPDGVGLDLTLTEIIKDGPIGSATYNSTTSVLSWDPVDDTNGFTETMTLRIYDKEGKWTEFTWTFVWNGGTP